ncbi:MAG: tripartite tricarboxylate transporter TctB family protein [Pseudomonadota bacterium]
MARQKHVQVGAAAVLFAAFLYFVGIPYGITAPTNIQNIVLSPLFWPTILAALLAVAGLALLAASRSLPVEAGEAAEDEEAWQPGAGMRLAAMAVLMAAFTLSATTIGFVWGAMIAFAATALLVKTRHPVAALVAAVLVPLVLYAFFAHVAGVAIPQGELVRLP